MKKILYILFSICLLTACSSDDPIADPNGDIVDFGGDSSDPTIEKANSLIVGVWDLAIINIDGVAVSVPGSDYQETMIFDVNNVSIATYNKDNQETSKNTYPYSFSVKSEVYMLTIAYKSDKNLILEFAYLREKEMCTFSMEDGKVKIWQKK